MEYIPYLIIFSLILCISNLKQEINQTKSILNKIASKLEIPTISDELKQELKILILNDQYVKAIKKYRIATGNGLKESKEYIDTFKILIQNDNNKS
jgi:ribosomal protein L7/L12